MLTDTLEAALDPERRHVREINKAKLKRDGVAVEASVDIGFIHVRVQASMPVNYFHDVIIKVALEAVGHDDMCTGRTIAHVLDVCCLLAEGDVNEDGVTTEVPGTQRAAGIVNDHRYCYGGKFCMRATAAL